MRAKARDKTIQCKYVLCCTREKAEVITFISSFLLVSTMLRRDQKKERKHKKYKKDHISSASTLDAFALSLPVE